MKIKPKKIYKDVFEAMKDCVDRLEGDLFKDGDVVNFNLKKNDIIEFEVDVKDDKN
jgi:hypothetical protein